jgi:hypothetical protein
MPAPPWSSGRPLPVRYPTGRTMRPRPDSEPIRQRSAPLDRHRTRATGTRRTVSG